MARNQIVYCRIARNTISRNPAILQAILPEIFLAIHPAIHAAIHAGIHPTIHVTIHAEIHHRASGIIDRIFWNPINRGTWVAELPPPTTRLTTDRTSNECC